MTSGREGVLNEMPRRVLLEACAPGGDRTPEGRVEGGGGVRQRIRAWVEGGPPLAVMLPLLLILLLPRLMWHRTRRIQIP